MGLIAGGIVGLAGAGLAAYGQSQAARTANNSARDRLNQNKADVLFQRDLYGSQIFGPQWLDAVDYNKTNPYWNKDARAGFNSLTDSLGGSLYGQVKNLSGQALGEVGQIPADYQKETDRIRAAAGNHLTDITKYWNNGTSNLMSQFDTGAAGIMGKVDQYGRGRESIIKQDAETSRKAADQAGGARLAASGLGSAGTLGANLASGNALQAEKTKQRALQDLSESKIGLETSTGTNLLGQRTGLQSSLFQGGAGARERGEAQILDMEQARSAGMTNLQNQAFDRRQFYRYQPTQFALNALGAPQINYASDQSGSIPLPSASPGAAAAGTLGSAATGIGSALGSYGLLQSMQSKGSGVPDYAQYLNYDANGNQYSMYTYGG